MDLQDIDAAYTPHGDGNKAQIIKESVPIIDAAYTPHGDGNVLENLCLRSQCIRMQLIPLTGTVTMKLLQKNNV